VTILGARQYAMRVWLNPTCFKRAGLCRRTSSTSSSNRARRSPPARSARRRRPKGQDFQYTLDLKGSLDDPREFENIIVKVDTAANGGRITRIRDIGRAKLGAQTYSESFNLDGRPAAGIAVSLLPEANAIEVSNEVKAKRTNSPRAFRRASSTASPTTRRSSCGPRSAKSIAR
jgi:hydrophobic/amphiphilic exporter-1 (mainly G- bacteria), HAE1 family